MDLPPYPWLAARPKAVDHQFLLFIWGRFHPFPTLALKKGCRSTFHHSNQLLVDNPVLYRARQRSPPSSLWLHTIYWQVEANVGCGINALLDTENKDFTFTKEDADTSSAEAIIEEQQVLYWSRICENHHNTGNHSNVNATSLWLGHSYYIGSRVRADQKSTASLYHYIWNRVNDSAFLSGREWFFRLDLFLTMDAFDVGENHLLVWKRSYNTQSYTTSKLC